MAGSLQLWKKTRIAIERGYVANGIPVLPVVADGTYAKRSYKTGSYSSLSGMAVIVGFYTREVFFISVRNQYCSICAYAERNGKEIRVHICYKNWNGSAGSMETDIISEGFRSSIELYRVIFCTHIADGDCSVYNILFKIRPYPDRTVVKIECRNHVLRNYANKLKEIATNGQLQHINLRKILAGSILRMRTAIVSSVRHWKSHTSYSELEQLRNFREDALNAPRHIFGDHSGCQKYFCTGKEEKIIIPELRESGILSLIEDVKNRCILNNARSLLKDADSNSPEQFNNIVAKFVGGKRINYCLRRSYRGRSPAAVVAYNTRRPLYKLHKFMYKFSPGKYTKTLENKRSSLKHRNKPKKYVRKITTYSSKSSRFPFESDYGPQSQKPDMTLQPS
ncbi:uncharacterized protein LOC134527812 [Bacillus rossius redtenbacheri]|uniref:uncharacterized protein LOC134527812 n=1 Tax=Bacillus rossius redtenbacheri TaxID=93214 RepID=UPI002FDD9DA7